MMLIKLTGDLTLPSTTEVRTNGFVATSDDGTPIAAGYDLGADGFKVARLGDDDFEEILERLRHRKPKGTQVIEICGRQ